MFYYLLFNVAITYGQPSILWQNAFGGFGNDYLFDLKVTSDGGVICGGASYSNTSGTKTQDSRGGADYWILKLDSSGSVEWEKTFGGSLEDYLFSIHQTSDGGYILGGRSESDSSGDKTISCKGLKDIWIIKLDENGSIQWQQSYGGNDDEILFSLQETWDHGYILGSYSKSNISGNKIENCIGSYDYWILKLDSIGNIIWQNTIGGSGLDALTVIRQTSDHNYILGGYSNSQISGDKNQNSHGSSLDYWILKIDPTGNIIWQKTIGGDGLDELSSLIETNDGGYLLVGESLSNVSGNKLELCRGLADFWIVKINFSGNIEWQRTLGGNNVDEPWAVIQTNDGNYLIGGYSESNISGDKIEDSKGAEDIWLIKLNQLGSIMWQKDLGGSDMDELSALSETSQNELIYGGLSISNISGDKTINRIGLTDFWILKTDFDSGISNSISENEIIFYPNPFYSSLFLNSNNFINTDLEIYNILGLKISEQKIIEKNQLIDLQYLTPGSYIFILKNQDKIISRNRIIKGIE